MFWKRFRIIFTAIGVLVLLGALMLGYYSQGDSKKKPAQAFETQAPTVGRKIK
jgi:hypothetical protein